ncbi:hypothetical protein LCGC14_2341850, partial [marine sediment metagenome]
MPEKEQFRKWLNENYGALTRAISWRADDWKKHELYQFWLQNVRIPEQRGEAAQKQFGEQITQRYGFPQMTDKEYKDRVEIHLSDLVEGGQLSKKEAGKQGAEASRRLTLEGMSPNLPYFQEVIAPTLPQFAQEQYAREYGQFQAGLSPQEQLQFLRDRRLSGISPEEERALQRLEGQEALGRRGIEAQGLAGRAQRTQFGQRDLPPSPQEAQKEQFAQQRQIGFQQQEQYEQALTEAGRR